MGLDIYLYRYDDYEKTKKIQEEYSRLEKEIWGGKDDGEEYKRLTEDEKESYRQKVRDMAISLGLDKWGEDVNGKQKVEFNSTKYPEHLFKVGYFRSSYNESGIKRILKNMGLPTMSDIFEYDSENYEFKPNWERALENIKILIEKFKEKGPYRVTTVHGNIFKQPTVNSEKDALDAFLNELKKDEENKVKNPDYKSYNYSNIVGEFSFSEPLKVLGVIPGVHDFLGVRECVYIITESDNTWYHQALEIIKETIEWVLSQDDKEKYYLHWSG